MFMSFFDSLGSKITNMSQNVAQTTKNLTSVVTLNSQVSEGEKKLKEVYCEIGKLYCEQNPISSDPQFSELVRQANALLANITGCREQIKELKGVIKCPSCGAEVSNNSAFCNSCGKPIPQQAAAPAGSVRCTKCGAFVAADCKFCTACGFPMETAGTPSDSAAPVPVANTTNGSAATPGVKICPHCGKELDADAVFCIGCGNQV